MPGKIFGNCVHKEDAEGGKGDLVPGGCHKTHAEAVAHMRALYASEAKDITDATLNLLKEIANDGDENKPERASAVLDEWKARVMLIPEEEEIISDEEKEKAVEQSEETILAEADEKAKRSDVSAADRARAEGEYGDVSYADETNKKYPLDSLRHAQAAARYFGMERNYSKYSPEERKKIQAKIDAALKKFHDSKKDLLGKLKEIADAIMSWFKDEPEDETGISVWKEGNQYWWMARYSNKFRDNDNPPEIISSESHKRFVNLVKEGKSPLPELWGWHKKEWKVGTALRVAYDELGFAVALGTFDPGREEVAEALMNSKESIKVSHGMPLSTIKRDEIDSTIIVEHETREISFLPAWAAANKLTGFVVLNLESKEESMAIPDETKQDWISKLGIKPETLQSLEEANAADADKAVSEGMESKETEEAQPAPTEPAEKTEVAETVTLTVAELKQAFQETVTNVISPVIERLNTLEGNLKELKEISDKRDEVLKGTPTASISALLGEFAKSAIGAEENRVDGRERLAKSKPKEAAANAGGKTIVPFINEMLDGNTQ
jgi:hypothetical protein